MKEIEKKRTPNSKPLKRNGKVERTDRKQNQENGGKKLNGKEKETKATVTRRDSGDLVTHSDTARVSTEARENTAVHCVDDVDRTDSVDQYCKSNGTTARVIKIEGLDDHSSDMEKQLLQGKEEDSDNETFKDSVSSHEELSMVEDEKVERAPQVIRSAKKASPENGLQGSRVRSDRGMNKLQNKSVGNTPKKSTKSSNGVTKTASKNSSSTDSSKIEVATKPSSETSEGVDDKSVDELKEIDILETVSNGTVDAVSNGAQSVVSDSETVDTEEYGEPIDEAALNKKIEEMEMRIEKLEEELREVAALEIALYSVVPEHGSSAHKVHTPARRLSRLYIHACKQWTQDKRASIAKNTISGLVLVAKACSNNVSRLTFWLSNTIVLREIISQVFGRTVNSSPLRVRLAESNGSSKHGEMKPAALKWKGGSLSKNLNVHLQFSEDWQETGTFTDALETVESWIFSRIVESVWWQALTPHMQPGVLSTNKSIGKSFGPALGDQQHGSFSINLWNNAFQDAAQRLCPVRAGGHECGCLPALSRKVMEQCIARLDVAMFNAILRESVHEIPTDPVSDPIVDPRVLPIPAGDLSFGSGAQLKNSVGNWSRWLTDMFGMDTDDILMEDQSNGEEDVMKDANGRPRSFLLLNELSDLLMLPKDMLFDQSVRKEVCSSISLPLIKRILCNFTPDEFCPDEVPGDLLEALNAESFVERKIAGESARSFPYTASPVVYNPPSTPEVAEKVAEIGGSSQLLRNVSAVQRKGYTSDDELDELDSPLTSIIDNLPINVDNGSKNQKDKSSYTITNARYELLREVWSLES